MREHSRPQRCHLHAAVQWHCGNTHGWSTGGGKKPVSAILSMAPSAGPSPAPATPGLLCPGAEEGGSSISTAPNCTSCLQQYIFQVISAEAVVFFC